MSANNDAIHPRHESFLGFKAWRLQHSGGVVGNESCSRRRQITAAVVGFASDNKDASEMSDRSRMLEEAIQELTKPINGQYPRPWMTDLQDPASATLFTVGLNQAKGYDVDKVGSHDHFIDTLFNRGKESCRALYGRVGGRASPTRKNTEKLVSMLKDAGAAHVLETNVICYSTASKRELKRRAHSGGQDLGILLGDTVRQIIKPKVIVAHGKATSELLGARLVVNLPEPPRDPRTRTKMLVDGTHIFVIPTLDPRHLHRWGQWMSDEFPGLTYLQGICKRAAALAES